ncbi:MAG: sensor histidine kinase [Gracilimonas sp.]|uniref:ATP-binding protein n=1 Tax=Gracilimonas TaxID=649462 RepID=UPI001B1EAD15|nr:ATP-binding protein [Gracilimonas sp.]MBO6587017.1 sensor histidine kinase [Gracilimonas sp.]MBO6614495.1 sensor histidine kinase [Gracilimonas sp.]
METSVMNPVPDKEFERIVELSAFDLDYSGLSHSLKDLTKLAAKVAQTEICLVNIIDSFTQWTVSSYGLDVHQMPREEGICQYTILNDHAFEVKDLSEDRRFQERDYVAYPPRLKYYFGLPLITHKGFKIGALCMLDPSKKEISPDKAEQLRIISDEIMERLEARKRIMKLESRLIAGYNFKRRLNHDIRGPIGGIIGLVQLIKDQDTDEKVSEITRYLDLIEKAGDNLLGIANKRLSYKKRNEERKLKDNELTLLSLKSKLSELYKPQVDIHDIDLTIANHPQCEDLPFPKKNVLPVIGNLISNVIRFTLPGEMIMVRQEYRCASGSNHLLITIKNTGSKLTNNQIRQVFSNEFESDQKVTSMNLSAIHRLLKKVGGSFSISDEGDRGNRFDVELPVLLTRK